MVEKHGNHQLNEVIKFKHSLVITHVDILYAPDMMR